MTPPARPKAARKWYRYTARDNPRRIACYGITEHPERETARWGRWFYSVTIAGPAVSHEQAADWVLMRVAGYVDRNGYRPSMQPKLPP